mmetsp:Transcript_119477/g.300318  ORF Transcript_119477/g.300318 Transcript_119477/m.300318 type:complete len:253 (-) Transcript_119477:80-838(-)
MVHEVVRVNAGVRIDDLHLLQVRPESEVVLVEVLRPEGTPELQVRDTVLLEPRLLTQLVHCTQPGVQLGGFQTHGKRVIDVDNALFHPTHDHVCVDHRVILALRAKETEADPTRGLRRHHHVEILLLIVYTVCDFYIRAQHDVEKVLLEVRIVEVESLPPRVRTAAIHLLACRDLGLASVGVLRHGVHCDHPALDVVIDVAMHQPCAHVVDVHVCCDPCRRHVHHHVKPMATVDHRVPVPMHAVEVHLCAQR